MKNVILALLLTLASTSALAANTDVSVGVASDYLYRGQSVTNGDPTVFGSVKFDNVVVNKAYISVDGVVVNLAPLNASKTVRADVGVGYAFDVTKNLSLDLSVHRVWNPVVQASDYNEARAQATFAVTDKFSVYGRVAKAGANTVLNDWYFAGGADYKGFMTPKLSVGALVSAVDSTHGGNVKFNNAEIYASYDIYKGLSAFGMYSFGGSTANRVLQNQVVLNSTNIPDGGMIGVRYSF